MRIAFVSQPIGAFVLDPGGSIEIWTYEMARRLAREHEVVVFARHGRNLPDRESLDGVRIERVYVPSDNRWVGAVSRRAHRLLARLDGSKPPFAASTYYVSYALEVARRLRHGGFDVAHVHNFAQFVPILRLVNPGLAIVLHMHCEWLTQLPEALVAPRLAGADRILGCSDFVTRTIRERFAHRAVATLHNGVDVKQFRPGRRRATKRSRLLFVGRVTPEKGLHVLIDAFARIADAHPACELDIIGPHWQTPHSLLVGLSHEPWVEPLAAFYDDEGNYLAALERRVPKRLQKRVHFRGLIGRDVIAAACRRADVLVNPALSEAFGMSLVEAMASSTPVVATRVGGMPEIVEEGRTGLLVDPDDSLALAEAMASLLQDRARREAMGAAGLSRAREHFSWDGLATRLEHTYAGLAR